MNSDEIALECRTCRPCQTGYWNNRLYGQMECMKCLLNCEALNRQENKPCGGSSPGLCGPCINRYESSLMLFMVVSSLTIYDEDKEYSTVG